MSDTILARERVLAFRLARHHLTERAEDASAAAFPGLQDTPPGSAGAALAGAGPTFAIAGDGGFLYAAGELATVSQERIPLTRVIVDDGGYGMLRYDQDVTGADRYGVDLVTPDFCALARSFGIRAQQVDGLDDEFGAALAEHVLDPEPSVLVAMTPEPLIPPPNTSPNWYRRKKGV